MSQCLRQAGYTLTDETRRADALIVNSCAFIRAAEEESAAAIRSLAAHKRPSQVLIVAGCLAERYGEKVTRDFPAVDGILGTLRWNEIAELVAEVRRGQPTYWLGAARSEAAPGRASQGPSAYIKIADGCDVKCAFCTIPSFKGSYHSKPAERVIAEARELVDQGIKEIILIGQNTSAYGRDLGLRDGTAHLLNRLTTEVPDLPWIRLMYAFPGHVTDQLLRTMADNPRVLKYIDIPLQHASRDVLARMGRPRHDLRQVVAELRAAIPGVAIRSTFIVGYPGETEAEFAELLSFLGDVQLDRVGVFKYSAEDGTPAARLPGQLPEALKEKRFRRVMKVQQSISLARNREQVGKVLDVLVEGQVAEEADRAGEAPFRTVGRSYRDAPEVDGLVLLSGEAPVGQIVPVRITGALEYDLLGEPAAGDRQISAR